MQWLLPLPTSGRWPEAQQWPLRAQSGRSLRFVPTTALRIPQHKLQKKIDTQQNCFMQCVSRIGWGDNVQSFQCFAGFDPRQSSAKNLFHCALSVHLRQNAIY